MSKQQQQQRCRVVVCGVGGRMGTIRTELVYANPRFELCGVCDINLEEAERIATIYSTEAFGDLESISNRFFCNKEGEVTDDNTIKLNGLIIAVPTKYHGTYIKWGAQNGLGIFVEKPVAESSDEIEELYTLCEKHYNVPLCCGFQRRFDDSYVHATNLIRNGKIGTITNATIIFGDSPGPSLEFLLQGGDIFYDLSVHDVDYIQFCLLNNNKNDDENEKEEITTVYACGSSSRIELEQKNIQDSATMMMTTNKGTVITLSMNRSTSYGYDQRCEIYGTAGKVCVGNEYETTTLVSDKDGTHASRLKNSFDTRFRNAFTNEINTFANVLLSSTSTEGLGNKSSLWPIQKEDVIRVQQIAAAAKKSLETKQIIQL